MSWKRGGSRLTSYGTTTSRPPCSNAPHISQTEKSNAKEWNRVQTSSGENRNVACVVVNNRATLPCVTMTALGCPVEPEVYRT